MRLLCDKERDMSMSFKFDDSELRKLQKKADALNGKHEIKVIDLMTDDFVRQHSSFHSFQALFDASGIKNPEDISNNLFSVFIASHTNFSNWKEMLDAATTEHVKRQLGL